MKTVGVSVGFGQPLYLARGAILPLEGSSKLLLSCERILSTGLGGTPSGFPPSPCFDSCLQVISRILFESTGGTEIQVIPVESTTTFKFLCI